MNYFYEATDLLPTVRYEMAPNLRSCECFLQS